MRKTRKTDCGSLMIIAIVFTVLLLAMASSYMLASTANWRTTEAYVRTTHALYYAEAGIEHSLYMLSQGNDGNVSGAIQGGNYSVTVEVLDAEGLEKNLYATGYCDNQKVMVKVRAGIPPDQVPFIGSMFAGDNINIGGQLYSDSYDSDCGSYSSQERSIDPVSGLPYANVNGGIGSNEDINVDGSNLNIFGNATPGPGGDVYYANPGANIKGSTDPSSYPVELPDPPYDPGILPAMSFPGGSPTITGGVYHYSSVLLAGKRVVTVSGDVAWYVDGEISTAGQCEIIVTPGSSLKIYHMSGTINMAGQGITNQNNNPTSLSIWSATTDLVNLAGQSDYYGTIYAPRAPVNYSGQADVYGSIVGDTVNAGGQGVIHYDEALSRQGTELEYKWHRVYSWQRYYD